MPDLHRARLRDIPAETLYRIMWLRVSVFVVEQQAAYPELDGRDLEPETVLLWVEEDGEVLATARVLLDEETGTTGAMARIGRVAAAPSARGRGLAADLMRVAVQYTEDRWSGLPITLDAQEHLADWYARFGFVISGPGFVEDEIPHVPMIRSAAG